MNKAQVSCLQLTRYFASRTLGWPPTLLGPLEISEIFLKGHKDPKHRKKLAAFHHPGRGSICRRTLNPSFTFKVFIATLHKSRGLIHLRVFSTIFDSVYFCLLSCTSSLFWTGSTLRQRICSHGQHIVNLCIDSKQTSEEQNVFDRFPFYLQVYPFTLESAWKTRP